MGPLGYLHRLYPRWSYPWLRCRQIRSCRFRCFGYRPRWCRRFVLVQLGPRSLRWRQEIRVIPRLLYFGCYRWYHCLQDLEVNINLWILFLSFSRKVVIIATAVIGSYLIVRAISTVIGTFPSLYVKSNNIRWIPKWRINCLWCCSLLRSYLCLSCRYCHLGWSRSLRSMEKTKE